MIVRGVDNQNDWLYGKGKNDFKSDLLQVMQDIKTALQCFYGDCFFDVYDGIDWFNLTEGHKLNQLKLAISSRILNREYVTLITELDVNVSQDRHLTIRYSVETDFGSINDTLNLGV